jgi:hypothetical protein
VVGGCALVLAVTEGSASADFAPRAGVQRASRAALVPAVCEVGTPAACFDMQPRLGPQVLPTTGAPGSIDFRIARMTRRYDRFGFNLEPGVQPAERLTQTVFLERYWDDQSPKPWWCYPPDGGFALDPAPKQPGCAFARNPAGMPAGVHEVTLEPGELVDRFGGFTGDYLAPAGTSYAKRSIPPSNLDGPKYAYHLFKVLEKITVEAGPIAPWFGQKGGGVQYLTCEPASAEKPWDCKNPKNPTPTIQHLMDNHFLKEESLDLQRQPNTKLAGNTRNSGF